MSELIARKPSGTFGALVGHTLRLQARGAAIWGVALGLYAAAMGASYLSFGDPGQIEKLVSAYPKGLLDAFGLSNMGTVEGYLSAEVFNLAPLALAFFPILACAGALAGAEERGTLDVLLGNPLARWQLVLGNFAATAISLLGIVVVVGAILYSTATLAGVDLSLAATIRAALNLWPVCLFFGGFALLCSAFFHRKVPAVALPGLVLVAMYLADALGRVSSDLEGLRHFSAFYYYGSAMIDGIRWASFFGLAGVAVLLALLAALAFSRRDIYT